MKLYLLEHGYWFYMENQSEVDGVYDEQHLEIAIERLLNERSDYTRENNIEITEININERIKN